MHSAAYFLSCYIGIQTLTCEVCLYSIFVILSFICKSMKSTHHNIPQKPTLLVTFRFFTVTCPQAIIRQNIPVSARISLERTWVTTSPWQLDKVALGKLRKLLWTHRFSPLTLAEVFLLQNGFMWVWLHYGSVNKTHVC